MKIMAWEIKSCLPTRINNKNALRLDIDECFILEAIYQIMADYGDDFVVKALRDIGWSVSKPNAPADLPAVAGKVRRDVGLCPNCKARIDDDEGFCGSDRMACPYCGLRVIPVFVKPNDQSEFQERSEAE